TLSQRYEPPLARGADIVATAHRTWTCVLHGWRREKQAPRMRKRRYRVPSTAFPPLQPAAFMPGLDDQMIRRAAYPSEDRLGDRHPEAEGRLLGILQIRHFHRLAGDLRVTGPGARVILGRIFRRAMYRDAVIAPNVPEFQRARHHPQHHLAID